MSERLPETGGIGGKSIDVFVSHRSDDEIAKSVFELLSAALPDAEIFFTTNTQAGLDAGERFNAMLERLRAAKSVVAVITPRALRSTAVLAEMTLAHNGQKLLPVVARGAYAQMLQWPFSELHARALDRPDEIRQLIQQLHQNVGGRLVDVGDEKLSEVASSARSLHWLPSTWQRLRRAAGAAGVLLLAGAAFAIGVANRPPTRIVVGSDGVTIDGKTVVIAFQGSFPGKLLSNRLSEIKKDLDLRDDKEATGLFLDAFNQLELHLTSEKRARLAAAVENWAGGDSNMLNASKIDCKQPREIATDAALNKVDNEWCMALRDALGDDGAKMVDQTPFAIVRIESPDHPDDGKPIAVTAGSALEELRWDVKEFGGLTLEARR